MHISSFQLDVSEAPEVYGASRYMEPHTSTTRFFGTLKVDPEEDLDVSGSYRDWNEDTLNKITEYTVNGKYHMGGFEGTASYEWYSKFDNAIIGFGLGYNDGLYHHITYGFNFHQLEFGTFVGFYHQYMHIQYRGSTCSGIKSCTSSSSLNEDKNTIETSLFWGMYAGFFFGNFFLNYSLSAYTPGLDTEDENVHTPIITSNYITLGFHINKHIAISAGAIGSDVSSQWHWGGSLGIAYYP